MPPVHAGSSTGGGTALAALPTAASAAVAACECCMYALKYGMIA